MDPKHHHDADTDRMMPQLAAHPTHCSDPLRRPFPEARSLVVLPEPSLRQWLRFGGKALALATLGTLPWLAVLLSLHAF